MQISVPINNFMMMIMPMESDCVCKLRTSTGLWFIPQVIYEHKESRWNDIDRGKLLIRPTELFANPTSRNLKGMMNVALRIFLFVLASDFLHDVRFYMGPSALLPLRSKACYGFFVSLKNPSPMLGLNPRTLGPMASTLLIDHRSD
jgi:hypothetical protein